MSCSLQMFLSNRYYLLANAGRNRELQGLARAMVKRWETSAIQKLPSNELFLIHVMKHYCFEELRVFLINRVGILATVLF